VLLIPVGSVIGCINRQAERGAEKHPRAKRKEQIGESGPVGMGEP